MFLVLHIKKTKLYGFDVFNNKIELLDVVLVVFMTPKRV